MARQNQGGGQEGALFEQLIHDLRNPLGVVAYFAEALPTAPEAERAELCERLQVNAQRLLHVLEEFALLADLRRGQARAVVAEWPGDALLHELVVEIETMERCPGGVRLDLQPVALRGGREHLACALRALVRESVRSASGERGVSLHLGRGAAGALVEVHVPLRLDAGSGIAAALDEHTLALELVHGVAALYGGSLTIEQPPGEAVLRLVLPLR
ncbi:MAG: sensor histidine kinase [Candidatus Binatia bacterium]